MVQCRGTGRCGTVVVVCLVPEGGVGVRVRKIGQISAAINRPAIFYSDTKINEQVTAQV